MFQLSATSKPPRVGLVALQAIVALAAFVPGFDFGHRIGGVLVGVLAATNCALFAALMVSGVNDWIEHLRDRRRRDA